MLILYTKKEQHISSSFAFYITGTKAEELASLYGNLEILEVLLDEGYANYTDEQCMYIFY